MISETRGLNGIKLLEVCSCSIGNDTWPSLEVDFWVSVHGGDTGSTAKKNKKT